MSLLNIPGYNSTFKTEPQEEVAVLLCLYAIVSNSLYVMTCLNLIMITLNQYLNELTNTILGNRIIGAVYRPPGYSSDLFMSGFVKVLSAISKTRTEWLIVGDFNVELLKYDENADTEDLLITCMNIYLSHLYLDQNDLI